MLIAEEMSLRDLRQALTLTQEHMAETLGIGAINTSLQCLLNFLATRPLSASP